MQFLSFEDTKMQQLHLESLCKLCQDVLLFSCTRNFIYDAYTGPLQEVDKVIKSGNSLGLKPHASLSFITNFPLFKQK